MHTVRSQVAGDVDQKSHNIRRDRNQGPNPLPSPEQQNAGKRNPSQKGRKEEVTKDSANKEGGSKEGRKETLFH